jgi:SAM-dependent methyltransferase
MTDTHDFGKSTSFWDQHAAVPAAHGAWMADPVIRDYINSAFDDLWPFDWFETFMPGKRFPRALSIGCGSGALERDVVLRNLCDRIDAFDGSMASLAEARAAAKAAGQEGRIRYFAADFNAPVLPPKTYDAIFIHQALHHVAKLEKLLSVAARALKPGGILYLDEYVGPSRTDWNDALMAHIREWHARLDPAVRVRDEMTLPVLEEDPSEAIRSGEILSQLKVGYDVETFRGYGGNVLTLAYNEIRWERAPADLLPSLIEWDREVARREIPFCAVIVARPKRGLRGLLARARYWFTPKWRRLRVEGGRRLGIEVKY